MRKLLLFDIDGTLIRSAGAGREAMNLALKANFNITDGFTDVPMMGRTDPLILEEIFLKYGLPAHTGNVVRFQESYFKILKEELKKPRENKRICYGIVPLLDTLEKEPDICLGLLTGNWRKSAFLKLKYFGLQNRFMLGAFSDDAPVREDLVPVAMNRYYERYGMPIDSPNVYVIGDTPLDVACAKPHGCKTVAVATGFHTARELQAAQPDYLFENFVNTDEVVSIFGNQTPDNRVELL